jgi:hypothetical protein
MARHRVDKAQAYSFSGRKVIQENKLESVYSANHFELGSQEGVSQVVDPSN